MPETVDYLDALEANPEQGRDETPYAEQFCDAVERFVFRPDDAWEVSPGEDSGCAGARLVFNERAFFLVADETNSIRGAARRWYREVVSEDPSRARG